MSWLLLVGRDDGKLAHITRQHDLTEWTTDLDAALSDADYPLFFDAAATHQRRAVLRVMAFNPTVDIAADYNSGCREVPAGGPYTNPCRVGWEDFLRHLVAGTPLRSDFAAGLRDIQLPEACHRSIATGGWVGLEDLGRSLWCARVGTRPA